MDMYMVVIREGSPTGTLVGTTTIRSSNVHYAVRQALVGQRRNYPRGWRRLFIEVSRAPLS